MRKSKKVKNKKTIEELKKLRLFGDSENSERTDELDNLTGGSQDTTVDTQWPTTTNKTPSK